MAFVVSDRRETPPVEIHETDAAPAASNHAINGAVVWVDARAGIAHVHFAEENHSSPVGTTMRVYRRMLNGDLRPVGRLTVVKTTAGGANVQAAAGTELSRYRRGDVVMTTRQESEDLQASRLEPTQGQFTLVDWVQQ